ncbi:MAG: hypothetical protein JNL58_08055 [Planctomyces sp.]|nr:hypothetical protein [Planctomyces sp.]
MARIVKHKWYDEEGDDDAEVQSNNLRTRLKVKTDVRMSWTKLRTLRPIPRHGEESETDPGFFLKKIHFKHESRLIWDLELDWIPFKITEENRNPLQRVPVITFDSGSIEIPADRDWKGRPNVNTAGETMLGIMRQIPTVDYSIAVNLAKDPAWIQTHLLAVNSDTVVIRGRRWTPRTLLFARVSASEYKNENKVDFSEFSLTIMANPLTWSQEVFNTGTVQLEEYDLLKDGKVYRRYRQKPIMEGSPPEPVKEPKPLDANGQLIQDALQKNRTEPIKASKLITLRFDIQPELPFNNVLPLK